MDEGEPLYREAINGARKTLGDAHPSTLISIGNLALLLQDQGKLDGAEPLYREAVSGAEKTLGVEHPTTVTMQENLDLLLRDMGKA